MSRGQIPEYELTSLSPQAVGLPGESRAAEYIARGMQVLGQALEKREQEKADLAATSRLGDFDLEYARLKDNLQKQYWDNPEEYPQRVRDESLKLREKYSSSLSGATFRRFMVMSEQYLTRDVSSSVNWSVGRENQKIVGDIKTGYQNIALKSETELTPASLKQRLFGPVTDPFSLTAQSVKARKFLTESEVSELELQTRKQIVQNGMDARIVSSAVMVYQDLAAGKYDGILTPAEIKTFISSAQNAMTTMSQLEQYRSLTAASVEISNLISAFNNGELTVGDINRNLMWAELNKGKKDEVSGESVISDHYLRGLQRLRDIALSQDFRTREVKATEELAFVQEFESKWNTFLLGKGPNSKASAKDYDDVLGLYADLLDAYYSRKIDQVTFENKKTILDNVNKNRLHPKGKVASLTEAFQKAGKYGFLESPNDIYSIGYSMIRKYVDKGRPDLSELEKLELRDQLLLEFTRRADDLAPELKKNKKQAATQLLLGSGNSMGIVSELSVYQLPDGGYVRPGQLVDTGIRGVKGVLLGIDSKTGLLKVVPKIDLAKEFER